MSDDSPATDVDLVVAERLAQVRERILAAGGSGVRVLAVTKSFPVEHCWAAYHAGCDAVGENYAQEVIDKFADRRPPFAVHFIGQLQTNKVRLLAPLVDVYESVDRPALVAELAKRAPGARVLVQVSPTDQPGKGGCLLADVPALVSTAHDSGLTVLGLMTVGPTVGGPESARPGFRAVRSLVDRLGLSVCSMGMTDDLAVAVQEGSTEVRVGSALFGRRPQSEGAVR